MSIEPTTLSRSEVEAFDRIDREGGLRTIASPHVHYDDPDSPRGCGHRMEWIDFKLELHGNPEEIDEPLVRSGWSGGGFVGRRPGCGGRIRFTTLGMTPLDDLEAAGPPTLPGRWADVAHFA